jgi:hypothetical protein
LLVRESGLAVPCPLLRLALPRELTGLPADEAPAACVPPDPRAAGERIVRLAALLPEWTWLSG